MFRSLHMKLVLIMLLLITSLMTIVGAFMMTSITAFYIDEFYQQMESVFGDSNPANIPFVASLRSWAEEENVPKLQEMIEAKAGDLGLNANIRNYYILDGRTGAYLAGSDGEDAFARLPVSQNLLTVRNSIAAGGSAHRAASRGAGTCRKLSGLTRPISATMTKETRPTTARCWPESAMLCASPALDMRSTSGVRRWKRSPKRSAGRSVHPRSGAASGAGSGLRTSPPAENGACERLPDRDGANTATTAARKRSLSASPGFALLSLMRRSPSFPRLHA